MYDGDTVILQFYTRGFIIVYLSQISLPIATELPLKVTIQKSSQELNPGNNLYVTGLSTRVTEKYLKDKFSAEGKVLECRLVVDLRTRESRGFGFVTMDSMEDAERCIKYLNHSILEGRVISVEKKFRLNYAGSKGVVCFSIST